jgi:hypothetical protein
VGLTLVSRTSSNAGVEALEDVVVPWIEDRLA